MTVSEYTNILSEWVLGGGEKKTFMNIIIMSFFYYNLHLMRTGVQPIVITFLE